MPQFIVTSPEGKKYRVTAPDGASQDEVLAFAQQKFSAPASAPAAPDLASQALLETGKYGPGTAGLLGIGEAGLQAATGALGTAAGGLAGLAVAPFKGSDAAADTVQRVQSALTYQPRTAVGQIASNVGGILPGLMEKGSDYLGQKTADVAGPAAGATVKTAIQAAPAVLLDGILGKSAAPIAQDAAQASEAAKNYVSRNTALDWNSLSQRFKDTLTTIAQDAKSLDNLDPKAVERQARLDSLDIPATRGQIMRDLPQLTREENITKSDAGQPIRDINAAQDTRLHALVDQLRSDTGATATTRQGVGKSVQGAERAKLDFLESEARKAYKLAEDVGDTMQPADVTPLKSWLSNPINRRNASFIESSLADFEKNGTVPINQLEDMRQEATAAARGGDKSAHYAGEAVRVIDGILDNAGSSAYRNARQAWRAMKDEFDRQGKIKQLVSEKGYSTDRAVALEDTFDQVVLKGSAEDIAKVKDSLTQGGNAQTQLRGTQAWKDLQAATLDYLKEKAAGKRAIVGENNQLQFNSTFRDAFNELDKDGKIDALFSPDQAKMLRSINDAVGDVRTKPTGRAAGSDTTLRIIAMLEKVSKIPVAGDFLRGTVKVGQKLTEMGRETRDINQAKTSPMDEAATAVKKAAQDRERRARERAAILKASPYYAASLERQQ